MRQDNIKEHEEGESPLKQEPDVQKNKKAPEHFRFFSHKECEFFPCHEVKDPEAFNCLFCYCPLYALGDDCGGNFTYTKGVKDCSKCLLPHSPGGFDYITKNFSKIVDLIKKEEQV